MGVQTDRKPFGKTGRGEGKKGEGLEALVFNLGEKKVLKRVVFVQVTSN